MIKSNKAANLATLLGLGGGKPKPKPITTGFKPGNAPIKPANSSKNPGNVVGFGGIGNKEVMPVYRNTGFNLK